MVAPLRKAQPDTRVIRLEDAGADTFESLLAHGRGEARTEHIDASSPLLLVYTSGTTGRPKGAVLRQEALIWNAVMSQHMHDLSAGDRRHLLGETDGAEEGHRNSAVRRPGKPDFLRSLQRFQGQALVRARPPRQP